MTIVDANGNKKRVRTYANDLDGTIDWYITSVWRIEVDLS